MKPQLILRTTWIAAVYVLAAAWLVVLSCGGILNEAVDYFRANMLP
jgi:hypothetical protein